MERLTHEADFGLFKYISCYSLSHVRIAVWYLSTNLNTSHVILYRIGGEWNPTPQNNLNTSHVILYRLRKQRRYI